MRVLFFMILLVATPAFAGEPRIYTNEDLERYEGRPTYDQETASRISAELKQWESEREAGERLQSENKETGEIREAAQKPPAQGGNAKKTKKS